MTLEMLDLFADSLLQVSWVAFKLVGAFLCVVLVALFAHGTFRATKNALWRIKDNVRTKEKL